MRTISQPVAILFAHYGLNWITGSERCLLDLVQHLDRRRFRPVVVCNTRAVAEAAHEFGAAVYAGPDYECPDGLFPPRELVARGRRIVTEQRIALIHANDFQPFKWLLPVARSARIPTLLHVHLPSTEQERCYSWAHQAGCVVGVSRFAIDGFLDDGLSANRCMVIYNGVDPARLSAGDATALRAELRIGDDEPVIAAVGSLIERKGVDTLIAAAARLRGSGRRFRVLLLGDGPERERLEKMVIDRELAGTVLFLGRRSDPGALLRDVVTMLVTAARQEALPLNVLEAGFWGVPVVASDIAPHREALEDGRTGLLVPVTDEAGYARAIAALIDDPKRRIEMGRAAAERIRRDFTLDRYVRQFTELYERLLAESPRRHGWTGTWSWPTAYSRWLSRAALSKLGPSRATAPVAVVPVQQRGAGAP